jgi:colicin import membrane protein
MATDTRDELIPLSTGFDQVWHGYDRGQVQHYVRSVDAELRLLATDRNAAAAHAEELTRQLERAREEARQLHQQVDRITRTPVDPEVLTERLRHMLELAQDEADEITARARTASTNLETAARQADEQRRRRHDRLVAELDARRQAMEAEHRDLMRSAQDEADRAARELEERREAMEAEHRDVMREATEQAERTTSEAEARRRELDEEAARTRAEVNADFEVAMTARRTEATREIEQRTSAAERDAARMVRDAEHEVGALNRARDQVAAALASAQELLTDAQSALKPAPRKQDRTRGRNAA